SVRFPKLFNKTIMIVHRPGLEPITFLLTAGETSPLIDVRLGSAAQSGGQINPNDQFTALGVAWRYVKLGFEHIIPQGLDHCLFVLGLFLLTPRWKPVLLQISAFTVAHTVTLT